MTKVDIFHAGVLTKRGFFKPRLKTAVLAFGHFPIHQQPQTLFEAESLDVGHFHLLLQGMHHAGKTQIG